MSLILAHDGAVLEVPPEVARAVHADAIRLKRGELFFALPFLALTAFVVALGIYEPGLFRLFFVPAIGVLVWVVGLGLELFKLHRTDPLHGGV